MKLQEREHPRPARMYLDRRQDAAQEMEGNKATAELMA